MLAGIADVHVALADHQPDGTESGRRFQRLLDLACRRIEENQVFLVFDDERAAVVGQGEIDGPAGECHLLAGWFEDLIGRHDDTAVGLDADLELIEVIGPEPRSRQRGEEREKEEGGVREQAYWHVAADLSAKLRIIPKAASFQTTPCAQSSEQSIQKVRIVL